MNKKAKSILSISILFILISLSCIIFFFPQDASGGTSDFSISQYTQYDILDNIIYLNITNNNNKKETINISSIFIDDSITDKIKIKDIYILKNVQRDKYDFLNVSKGKIKTINYTQNNLVNVTHYYDKDDIELYCDYLENGGTCLKTEYIKIGEYTSNEYILYNISTKKERNNGKIILSKEEIDIDKNEILQLKLIVSHPILNKQYSSLSQEYNISVFNLDNTSSGNLDPAWWNDSWDYNQQVNFTAGNGNFTYINVTYDGDMQSDFDDLRFVNSTETGILNYTIESYISSTYATIRLQSLGDPFVYMYYGNALAPPVSNTSATYFGATSVFFMDEPSGTVMIDAYNTVNGTIFGTTVNSAGVIEKGYSFDGVNDHVNISATMKTISLWVRRNDTAVNYILDGRQATANSYLYYFPSNGLDWGTAINYVYVNGTNFTKGTAINSGVWYHMVIYFPTALSRTEFGTINTVTGDNFLFGNMDEIRIWNRELTTTEIAQLFTSTMPTVVFGIEQINNIAPQINLNAPANLSTFNNLETPTFNFTAIDDINTILNCSIYLDDVLNQMNATTYNNTLTNFLIPSISYTYHNWSINCSDGSLSNISETRNFWVNEPFGCIGTNYNFTCGETVNESCIMNTNLTSSGTCFTIGANDIIVDGAGYTLDGTTVTGNGIYATLRDNLTVKNILITDFEYGIYIDQTNNSVFENGTTYLNGVSGIEFHDVDNTSINNYTGYNNLGGVLLFDSDYNNITNTLVYGTGVQSQGIIFQQDSDNNLVDNVTSYGHINHGINIDGTSGEGDNNVFRNSNFSFNSNAGIQIYQSGSGGGNNTIYNNTIENNAVFGAYLYLTANTNVTSNRFISNPSYSLHGDSFANATISSNNFTSGGTEIYLINAQSSNNLIEYNTITSCSNLGMDLGGNNYTLYRNNISDCPYGIWANNGNITDTDGTYSLISTAIVGANSDNIYVFLINHTADIVPITTEITDTAKIYVQGYLDTYVNYTNGSAVDGANVLIYSPIAKNIIASLNESDLLLWLTFDNTNAMLDNSTYRHNATDGDNSTNISGKFGSARYLNGTQMMTANYSTINPSGPFSLESWVNITEQGTDPNVLQAIISGVNSGSLGFELAVIAGATTYIPYFNIGASGQWYQLNSNQALNYNEWHYISGTYDGNVMKIYIDGVLDNSLTVGVLDYDYEMTRTIGGFYWDEVPSGRYLYGTIDEVKIWNVSLTSADILNNNNTQSPQYHSTIYDYLYFNVTTNSSGYIERQNVTEYFQNATNKYYYTNYSINASDSMWYSNTSSVNLTSNMITDDGTQLILTLENSFNTAPQFNSLNPTNNTWNALRNVNFSYNVTDNKKIVNCSQSIYYSNGTEVITRVNTSAITNNTIHYENYTVPFDGFIYTWNISCWDNESTPVKNSSAIYWIKVGCGDLTVDKTFNNNISIINGTCLNISGDNITIDGGGYSIVGDETGFAFRETTNWLCNNTIIKNINIYNFSGGINMLRGENLTVYNSYFDNIGRLVAYSPIFSKKVNNLWYNNTFNNSTRIYPYGNNSNVSFNKFYNCNGHCYIDDYGSGGYGKFYNYTLEYNYFENATDFIFQLEGYNSSYSHNILKNSLIGITNWKGYNSVLLNNSIDNCSIGTDIYGADENSLNILIKDSYINNSNTALLLGYADEGCTHASFNNIYQNIKIENSVFDINSSGDFVDTECYANNTLLNVSFNKSKVNIGNFATIYVNRYLDVFVKNQSSAPINDAIVRVYDKYGTPDDSLILTTNTNSSGYIQRQNITEYYENATARYYSTPYKITATAAEYDTRYAITSLTTNNITNDGTNINITLNSYGSSGGQVGGGVTTGIPVNLSLIIKSPSIIYKNQEFNVTVLGKDGNTIINLTDLNYTYDKNVFDLASLSKNNVTYILTLKTKTDLANYYDTDTNITINGRYLSYYRTENVKFLIVNSDIVPEAVLSAWERVVRWFDELPDTTKIGGAGLIVLIIIAILLFVKRKK